MENQSAGVNFFNINLLYWKKVKREKGKINLLKLLLPSFDFFRRAGAREAAGFECARACETIRREGWSGGDGPSDGMSQSSGVCQPLILKELLSCVQFAGGHKCGWPKRNLRRSPTPPCKPPPPHVGGALGGASPPTAPSTAPPICGGSWNSPHVWGELKLPLYL